MKTCITLTFGILLIPIIAIAGGAATVNWADPADYKDVVASSGSQEEFQAKTFKELEDTIRELASSLPEGQKLEMTVTDLDLAGDVRLTGARTQHQDVRVVKDMYPARMTFHYRLLDASGKVLKEGDEKLQGRATSVGMRTSSSGPLEIEKRMLRSWFKHNIAT
ncbi:DUF3016 domain-containing protein [Thiolapillus sp.]